MIREKIGLRFFKICKYTIFNIWKREIAKKLGKVFWRFVSMFFLIFEKGNKEKNSASLFKICKYTFFNIWKTGKAKKKGYVFLIL